MLPKMVETCFLQLLPGILNDSIYNFASARPGSLCFAAETL